MRAIVHLDHAPCGMTVALPFAEVSLRGYGGRRWLDFVCPECGTADSRVLAGDQVVVLVANGLMVQPGLRLGERSTGPPFTFDDLIAFHRALEGIV